MKTLSVQEHFRELQYRIKKTLTFFVLAFLVSYCYKYEIYNFILQPLVKVNNGEFRKIIYTDLTEAFFSYLKLSACSALIFSIPVINWQLYRFILPGLLNFERKIAVFLLTIAPILFLLGFVFVYYYAMPNAWNFFISFEHAKNTVVPLMLEAKISEYINLTIQFIIAFGVAFQLPIIMVILKLLNIINAASLIKHRRIAIVINFIIAAILTPPDILSQFLLAIPMISLYELSILIFKFLEKHNKC
ncbi:twin-arginine translocase subunit TatC [Rickettsia endosymbiont of Cardiosporidium cionae]|uniref:twin-arginine translocase subunit TatC n=1 Tax=Rickettsia endosymbiont of Cardiosporidium cionae TaxID=2777155 RepID=UPI00189390A2|nr:twin-arginine translocase subunit TatC [Rickettsia endosymbiont of Cardiosporidium cionae]